MQYLIVNGDDFGISAGVNRGIVEAHRLGILTSAVRGHSTVVPVHRFYGPWAGETHRGQVSVPSPIGMLETAVGEGVTELICHPAHVDGEFASSGTRERAFELRTLCDPLVRETLDRAAIRLVGSRDVARLPAAAPWERDGVA